MIPPLKHIVCIDDDENILLVARLALKTMGGYRVSAFSDSWNALREVRHLRPDMILLDAIMPGMDGPTVLKTLRENMEVSNIPIFFLTAKTAPEDAEYFLSIGADGVLNKPFDPMTLAKQVKELWEQWHAKESNGTSSNG